MKLNEYQDEAMKFASYPDVGKNIVYVTLGLVGESGETAEKVKKVIRDQGGIMLPHNKEAIIREISDCLWYLAALSAELGTDLETVAKINLEKLQSRKDRGVIGGSGDNR